MLPASFQVAAIALLYFATAKLGFLLSPPPGNVSPVWIPSGIALAAIVVFGWRGAGGIVLGSFAVNLQTLGASGNGIPVSAAIAAGSLLQAGFAAWLLVRFVLERRHAALRPQGKGATERRTALQPGESKILQWFFRALGTLLASSMLAASAGAAALCAGSYVPWDAFALLWRTWWLGDLAGFLVIGPGALYAFGFRLERSQFSDNMQQTFALLFIGIGVIGWSISSLGVHAEFQKRLQQDVDRIATSIQVELSHQIRYGEAIQALFDSTNDVSRTQFSLFAKGILEPGSVTRALSYLARVPSAQKAAWEERQRREVGAAYAILERDTAGALVPAAGRADYFPVHYIEPLAGNERALGLDIGSEAIRRSGLERARDTGKTTASAPVRLVQEQGAEWGVLLFEPIFRANVDVVTIEVRRAQLTGYASIVLLPQRLMNLITSRDKPGSIHYGLFDTGPASAEVGSATASKSVLLAHYAGSNLSNLDAWQQGTHASTTFEFAGRQRLVIARPDPKNGVPLSSSLGWTLLAAFIFLSGAMLHVERARQKLNWLLAVERDMLESRVAEKTEEYATVARATQRAEELLRAAIEASDDGIAVYDAQDSFVMCNNRYRDIFPEIAYLLVTGARFEDTLRESARRIHLAQGKVLDEAWITRQISDNHTPDGEQAIEISDGRWLRFVERRALDGSRVSFRSDVTILKKAEIIAHEQADDARTMFAEAIGAMNEAFVAVNDKGTIVEWAGASEQLFGYKRADALGRELAELIVPARFRDAHRKGLEYALRRGPRTLSRTVEYPALRRDGKEFPARIHMVSFNAPLGRRIYGFIDDITESKRAEEILRASEERYRTLTESTSAAILLQIGDRLVEVNNASCRVTGYSRDELLEIGMLAIVNPNCRAAYLAKMKSRQTNEDIDKPIEISVRCKDSTERWLSVTMVRSESGADEAILVTAIDITDRKKAENSLVQAQKMEAVGQLTGGLAHDFNNLLGVIIGNLDLLLPAVEGNERNVKRVTTALGAATRGANLTRGLLAVARRQSLAPERVELIAHLQEMFDLLRTTVGHSIELRTALGTSPLLVNVDLGGLDASVLNLVVNARDALVRGGTITLSSESRTLESSNSGNVTYDTLAPGQYAVIAISDNGPGMPPQVAARAFDPFFTTKERGRGTGLGLAMVHGFCRQSGGDARIYSELGHGTTVRLFLPLAAEATEAQAQNAPLAPLPRGTERVLAVDDEHELVEITCTWLEELGYAVHGLTDSNEALLALEEGDYDLLVTDVVMPKMNGFELARHARIRNPGLALLYVSGFADASLLRDETASAELLEKPFTRSDLARAVRRALDREEEPGEKTKRSSKK